MFPTMALGGPGRSTGVAATLGGDEEPNGVTPALVDVPPPDDPPDDSPDPLKIASSASPTSAVPITAAVESARSRPGGDWCNMAERFSFALRLTRGSGLRVACTKSERARWMSRGTPLPSA